MTEPTTRARPARKEEIKKQRRRRGGNTAERNMRLYVPEEAKDPNYVYRFINDTPGRKLQLTQHDDYEIVTEEMLDEQLRKNRKEEDRPVQGEGTVVRRPVGTGPSGEWLNGYLVRKPREYYEQDKAEEQASIADAERRMKEGPTPSADGLNRADHAYVPQGHQNVIGD